MIGKSWRNCKHPMLLLLHLLGFIAWQWGGLSECLHSTADWSKPCLEPCTFFFIEPQSMRGLILPLIILENWVGNLSCRKICMHFLLHGPLLPCWDVELKEGAIVSRSSDIQSVDNSPKKWYLLKVRNLLGMAVQYSLAEKLLPSPVKGSDSCLSPVVLGMWLSTI